MNKHVEKVLINIIEDEAVCFVCLSLKSIATSIAINAPIWLIKQYIPVPPAEDNTQSEAIETKPINTKPIGNNNKKHRKYGQKRQKNNRRTCKKG